MRRYVYKMEDTYKVNIGNKCVDATELLYCDGPLLLLIDDGDLFYKFKTLRSEKKEYWVYIKRSSNTELFLFNKISLKGAVSHTSKVYTREFKDNFFVETTENMKNIEIPEFMLSYSYRTSGLEYATAKVAYISSDYVFDGSATGNTHKNTTFGNDSKYRPSYIGTYSKTVSTSSRIGGGKVAA